MQNFVMNVALLLFYQAANFCIALLKFIVILDGDVFGSIIKPQTEFHRVRHVCDRPHCDDISKSAFSRN